MAATAITKVSVEIDGLGSGVQKLSCRYSATAPEEMFYNYQVIGTSAASLDLGGIAATKVRGVMMRAVGGTIGVLVNDVGTGTPSATAGNIMIPSGASAFIPIGGGLTTAYTIRVIGSAAAVAIEYLVYGQET